MQKTVFSSTSCDSTDRAASTQAVSHLGTLEFSRGQAWGQWAGLC